MVIGYAAKLFMGVNKINIYIQLKDPILWQEIRKQFYPNFIDKIKGWFS